MFLGNAAKSQDENFYIFLAFGQSNMDGHSKFEAEDTVGDDRFKMQMFSLLGY
jgi:hypothetical protein